MRDQCYRRGWPHGEEQDGDKGSCMSIQLVAMDMEKAEESMSEKADKIWPTS